MSPKKAAPKKAVKEHPVPEHLKGREYTRFAGGSGQIHKWGLGVEVSGVYRGKKEILVRGKKGFLFDLLTDDGILETWGCPAILSRLLENVRIGQEISAVCIGQLPAKPGQNPAWDFELYRIEDAADES